MVRPLLASLLLLVALLAVPGPGQAQDAAPAPLLEDPAGDVVLAVRDTPATTPTTSHPAVDLRSLALTETPTEFVWTLTVEDLRPGNEETGADGVDYEVTFQHNGRFFLATVWMSLPAISPQPALFLSSRDAAEGEWTAVWGDFDSVAVDYAADTLTFPIPREMLADRDGAAPFPGRTLDAIAVASKSSFSDATVSAVVQAPFPYSVRDAMPAADGAPATYAVGIGVQQSGHARLASPMPFRASNGEATTFVYQVDAINLADETRTFELAAASVPARVTVVVPVPLLALDANETLRVPVLATIPFGHDHGSLDRFVLELRDLEDPASVGRIELGVRYLAVPQPAGHHDTLYLHPPATAGQGVLPFENGRMDTIQGEGEAPSYSTGFGWSPGAQQHSWTFQLSPGLEMGLDLDLGRIGHATIPIGTTLPMTGVELYGTMYVAYDAFGDNDAVEVTSFQAGPVDLMPNAVHTFDVDLPPSPAGDRIAFEPGRNLWLDLTLVAVGAAPTLGTAKESVYVAPGASLQLPLNEWHDSVDQALSIAGGPAVWVEGAQERLVNPGEAVVFSVLVENPSDEAVPYRFDITGTNLLWSSLPDNSLTVPANGTGNVTLIVRAPADARDGDRADLIVQAYPRGAPELRALVRLVVEADTDADHVDESAAAARAERGQGAPAVPAVLVAAALLALAARRRRAA